MPALLHLLSYVGALIAFIFVTLSLASGLLWIAELIEEHSRAAKTIGVRAIYVIIVLHAALYITDGLPFWYVVFGIICHVVYLQHFSKAWPFISLTSPTFIASCVLVVADHFIWFFHFAGIAQEAKKYRASRYRYSASTNAPQEAPSFMDVATFFALCVWFIPLFLFLSLSANDNVIPSFDSSAPSTPLGGTIDLSGSPASKPAARSSSLVKSVLTPIVSFLPRLGRRGRNDEGLIAPRPASPSPRRSVDGYSPWGSESGSPAGQPRYNPSLSLLDTRLNAAAASRITTPPPRRPEVKRSMTTTTDYEPDSPVQPLSASGHIARPASAASIVGAVRNRQTSENKKAD